MEAATFLIAIEGSVALSASPHLLAEGEAARNLELLWERYISASVLSAQKAQTWRMMRSAAGASGQTGFLYQEAYEAEQAADQAYITWQAASREVFPGVPG